jgi:phosphoglycerol transferase MdoB-like AlkP superfamily enzyme
MSVPFVCIFSAYGFGWLLRSLPGVMIWICGVFIIWFFLSTYALEIKFMLWVLVLVGILVTLIIFHQQTKEIKK